jgi:hypothetical protein
MLTVEVQKTNESTMDIKHASACALELSFFSCLSFEQVATESK